MITPIVVANVIEWSSRDHCSLRGIITPSVETAVAERSKDIVHNVVIPDCYVSGESFMTYVKLAAIKHLFEKYTNRRPINHQATFGIAFDSSYIQYFPTAVSFNIAFDSVRFKEAISYGRSHQGHTFVPSKNCECKMHGIKEN